MRVAATLEAWSLGAGWYAGGQSVFVARFYIYFTTLPTLSEAILATSSGDGLYFNAVAGTLCTGHSTLTMETGVSVTTGQYYRVDLSIITTDNPHLTNVQVDGNAGTQHSNGAAGGTQGSFDWGSGVAATVNLDIDDWWVSHTSGDYPYGAGKVTAHAPTYDGTHAFTITNAKRSAAGSTGAITVTSTNVWQVLDDFASATNLGASDWAAQETSAAAEYLAIGFASTTDTTNGPRAVQLITVGHHLTTAQANNKLKLLDNGTTALFFNRASSGSSALTYHTTQYASMIGGGAWTKARFDAVQIRWGYSTDANPDVFLDAALIEAEFAEVAAGPTTYVVSATAMNGTGTLSGTIAFVRTGIAAAI